MPGPLSDKACSDTFVRTRNYAISGRDDRRLEIPSAPAKEPSAAALICRNRSGTIAQQNVCAWKFFRRAGVVPIRALFPFQILRRTGTPEPRKKGRSLPSKFQPRYTLQLIGDLE